MSKTFTCNCEHVRHFPMSTPEDARYEPREWADIERDGHPYQDTFVANTAATSDYVGTVCRMCFTSCLGHSLSEIGK